MNARGGDGAEVIYALRSNDTLPKMILNNLKNEGQNIRDAYTRRLPSNPLKDYYFMLRNTGDTNAQIIEYGFLDSTNDDALQLKNNWQRYAESVVKAIAEYLNIPYEITNDNEYIVSVGDTLWSIAKKYNISVNELKELNNLTNNLLKVGMILQIPNNDYNNIYVVKNGDTLYSISKKNNISVSNLKRLNNITSDILKIGQKIVVKEIGGQNYIVKAGDTLWNIAQRFGTTVNLIRTINNLKNDILTIGQELKIK